MKITIFNDNWAPNNYFQNKNTQILTGDVIKLKSSRYHESFWVIVTQICANDRFIGRVNNNLVNKSPYNYDDLVSFAFDDIRDHKNSIRQEETLEIVKEIIYKLSMEIGRMPTMDEVQHMLTIYTPLEN